MQILLLGTKVPGDESSWERTFHGTPRFTTLQSAKRPTWRWS